MKRGVDFLLRFSVVVLLAACGGAEVSPGGDADAPEPPAVSATVDPLAEAGSIPATALAGVLNSSTSSTTAAVVEDGVKIFSPPEDRERVACSAGFVFSHASERCVESPLPPEVACSSGFVFSYASDVCVKPPLPPENLRAHPGGNNFTVYWSPGAFLPDPAPVELWLVSLYDSEGSLLHKSYLSPVPVIKMNRWGILESMEEASKRDPEHTFSYETPQGRRRGEWLKGGVVYWAGVRSVNAAGVSEEVVVKASPCVDCVPPPPTTTTTTIPVVEEVSDGGFTSVTAGWAYSCGLRVDRSVECWEWRSDWFGHPDRMMGARSLSDPEVVWSKDLSDGTPPGGEFVMVDAGWAYACGILSTGEVECWGWNPVAALKPPGGEFTMVSAGLEHACALRLDGEVECWGVSSHRKGVLVLPYGPFTAISAASRDYLCGLRPGGEVECWGGGFEEGSESPGGIFEWINTDGGGNMCGLRPGGRAECWAETAPEEINSPPAGEFSMVSAGQWWYACGLRLSGEVECWYHWAEEEQAAPAPEGKFTWVSIGHSLACGLPVGGGVVCWDVQTAGESPWRVSEEEFKSLSSSWSHHCGLQVDGEVECWLDWGDNEFGEASPPGGRFESVNASDYYSCGLRPSGEVECWGSDEFGKSTPPDGVFTQITTSKDFACGLRADGEVECWGGRDSLRQQTKVVAPRERLVTVDAGWGGWSNTDTPGSGVLRGGSRDWGSSCGLRTDGTPLCWGDGSVLHPPEGEFLKVRMGTSRACGLRPGGSVECWGRILVADEDAGWAYKDAPVVYTDPSGEGFADVQLGAWHACGLRPDGGVYCWNWRREARGREYALEGPYVSISAGFSHSCGLRPDGGVDCWGLTGGIQRLPEAES